MEEPAHLVALRLRQLRLGVAELVHLLFFWGLLVYFCWWTFVCVCVCVCVVGCGVWGNGTGDGVWDGCVAVATSSRLSPLAQAAQRQRTIRRISGVWKRRQPFLALLAS